MGVAADQVAGEERRTVLLVEDDALLFHAAEHLPPQRGEPALLHAVRGAAHLRVEEVGRVDRSGRQDDGGSFRFRAPHSLP